MNKYFPVSLHIPKYNYCGPGTLKVYRQPVNDLDNACREHDWNYYFIRQQVDRGDQFLWFNVADIILIKKSFKLIFTTNTKINFYQRAASCLVIFGMFFQLVFRLLGALLFLS